MASTASNSHSLPSSAAAPASAFLDDHPLFLPSFSSPFLDDQAASFHLPSGSFPAAAEQDPPPPPPPRVAMRKPPRKRPRASRRAPTTVLTTDASNFRAMVQEFTGFPAPPPFAEGPPHLLPGGVIFGAGPPDSAAVATPAPFQLLRPSPVKLPASHASPPDCTTSNTSSLLLDALALFAKTNAVPPPAAAPTTSWPFDDGFEAAEGEWASPGHGLFSYRN